MRVIDVPPNAIPHRAANQNIREVMILPREARDADRAGNSVSHHLHQPTVMVFVRYHGCQRPGFDAVSGWKGRSAVKEVTAIFAGERPTALSDFFKRRYHQRAVNQRFSAEQASLSGALVMLCPPEQIKR
ncbi:MAG: hypothetical protein QOH71_4229 [Blastocatellia bacterium]|nr:hypothetical protein [Blastocatellia bacterium]